MVGSVTQKISSSESTTAMQQTKREAINLFNSQAFQICRDRTILSLEEGLFTNIQHVSKLEHKISQLFSKFLSHCSSVELSRLPIN